MKILVINHSPFIGSGSGTYTMNIAKALKNKGETVKVITAANSLEMPDMEDIEVTRIFFKNKEHVEGELDFNVPCFDQYPTSDVVFYNLTNEQLYSYENEFRKVLEKEIKEFKPDVIHTQHIWIWSSIVTEYNVPVIITSHGSDMMGYDIDNSFYKYCMKAILGSNKIVTISKKNYEDIIQKFPIAKDKCVILKNGYDEKIFNLQNYNREEILKEFNINKKYENIVLFAGRLTENKGIDILLNSAKKYEDGNTLTIIAGGGGLLPELEKQVEDLELKDVVFVGDQSQENLSKLYNISDVLAAPSRVEGFGLVGIEALACGTPVIGTKEGGMSDFITEEYGDLVNIENSEMLYNSIIKVLNNKEKFDKNKLANYVKQNYSQDAVIGSLIKEYKKVL